MTSSRATTPSSSTPSATTSAAPPTASPAPGPSTPAVVELSVVLPCLNEAETVAICVRKAHALAARRSASTAR